MITLFALTFACSCTDVKFFTEKPLEQSLLQVFVGASTSVNSDVENGFTPGVCTLLFPNFPEQTIVCVLIHSDLNFLMSKRDNGFPFLGRKKNSLNHKHLRRR